MPEWEQTRPEQEVKQLRGSHCNQVTSNEVQSQRNHNADAASCGPLENHSSKAHTDFTDLAFLSSGHCRCLQILTAFCFHTQLLNDFLSLWDSPASKAKCNKNQLGSFRGTLDEATGSWTSAEHGQDTGGHWNFKSGLTYFSVVERKSEVSLLLMPTATSTGIHTLVLQGDWLWITKYLSFTIFAGSDFKNCLPQDPGHLSVASKSSNNSERTVLTYSHNKI